MVRHTLKILQEMLEDFTKVCLTILRHCEVKLLKAAGFFEYVWLFSGHQAPGWK